MNRCSFNKQIVASILLLIPVEMGCSNYYNPEFEQNQLVDQTTNTLLNPAPNFFSFNGQIATLALFAEEEALQMPFQEVDYKKIDDQKSGPVQTNLTLGEKNFSRIKKLDASALILPRHIDNNNEQLRNQELVSLFSFSLNHEVRDVNNFTQSQNQVIISEKQVDLYEEVNQEDTPYNQIVKVIQVDATEVQQTPNHTLSIEPLQTLINLQEEVDEETGTDTDVDEQEQQDIRIFDFQKTLISLIFHGTVFVIFTVLSFVILGTIFLFNYFLINYSSSTELIIMSIFVMLIPFFLLIAAIHYFRRAYIIRRMLTRATSIIDHQRLLLVLLGN